jgi:hypothetical protein
LPSTAVKLKKCNKKVLKYKRTQKSVSNIGTHKDEKNNNRKIVKKLKIKIENCEESQTLRSKESPKAFTRKGGKIGAYNTVLLILRGMKNSLQSVLDGFFREISEGEIMATKQAISQARQQVTPLFVREFFDENVEVVLEDDTLKTFKGKYAIGIDGSDIALENEKVLIEEFGCSGSKKNACTALSSFACDVYTGIAYDCRIAPYSESERNLLNTHAAHLANIGLGGNKSILIGDRGYPSYDEFAHLIDKGFDFLFRLPLSWSNVISQIEDNDTAFEFTANGNKYDFRVLVVTLSTGETEYLATSLAEDFLSPDEAKDLYWLRWGNETKYDHLKNTLELENFSGRTVNSIYQDFYAAVTLANIVSAFAAVADVEIAANDEFKNLKYQRKANRNTVAYNVILTFLALMIETDPVKRQRELDNLFARIIHNPVSIVTGRKSPRKAPRNKRFHANKRK